MRKDQRSELERLEAALLEADAPVTEEAADEWLEDFYEEPAGDFSVRNTDPSDVDLDDYSEDVYSPPRRGGCLIPLMILLTLVLAALTLYLLKLQGVISW